MQSEIFDYWIGLPREPKYTHLKNLHTAIKMCEGALVSSDARVTKLGNNQEVIVEEPTQPYHALSYESFELEAPFNWC